MVDLDGFRRINDTDGHPVGNLVIATKAQLLLTARSASKAGDRMTARLDGLPPSFEYQRDGHRRLVSFSFSGGVTAWVAGDTTESIVKRADKALYDDRRRGNKGVETCPRSMLRGLMG